MTKRDRVYATRLAWMVVSAVWASTIFLILIAVFTWR